jgi:hypothetical protein
MPSSKGKVPRGTQQQLTPCGIQPYKDGGGLLYYRWRMNIPDGLQSGSSERRATKAYDIV